MGASARFRPVQSSHSLNAALLWEKFPRQIFYSTPNVLVSELTVEPLERYEAKMTLPGLGMPEEVELNGPSQEQQKEIVKHKRKRLCEIIKSATEKRMAKAKAPETIPASSNTVDNTKMWTAFANVPVLAPAPRSAAPAFSRALPTPAPSPPSVAEKSNLARLSEALDNAQFETYLNNIQNLGSSDNYHNHQVWMQVMENAERDAQRRKGEKKIEKEDRREIEEVADMPSKKDAITDTLEIRVNGKNNPERKAPVAAPTFTAAIPVRSKTWPTMNSSKDSPEANISMETFAAYIPPHKRPGYQCEPSSSPPKGSPEQRRRHRGGRGGRA